MPAMYCEANSYLLFAFSSSSFNALISKLSLFFISNMTDKNEHDRQIKNIVERHVHTNCEAVAKVIEKDNTILAGIFFYS